MFGFLNFLFFLYFLQAEEEARSLQKKIQQIENDLDQTQEQLTQVNGKLEEKEKALQNVSNTVFYTIFLYEQNGKWPNFTPFLFSYEFIYQKIRLIEQPSYCIKIHSTFLWIKKNSRTTIFREILK